MGLVGIVVALLSGLFIVGGVFALATRGRGRGRGRRTLLACQSSGKN